LLHNLRNLASKKKTAQVFALYLTMGLTIVISIGVSVVNTHALGSEQFGDLKFLQTLFAFIITGSTLGMYVSGGRLIAEDHDESRISSLAGAMLVVTLLLYVFMMVVLFVLSYSGIAVLQNGLDDVVRLVIPLLVALPLQICLENLLKGQNKIYELAFLRITPGAAYLVIAILITKYGELTLNLALSLYLGTIASVGFVLAIQSRPVFTGMPGALSVILKEVRRYGVHVYFGIIANVGTTLLGGLLLAFFLDTTSAGYFILARTIAAPLTLIATNIGTVFFRSFAQVNNIPPRVFLLTVLMALLSLALFLLVIGRFIDYVYPSEFSVMVQLVYIISAGTTLQGIGGFVNQFLCAKGHGKKTRNAAFMQGALNCLGFTVLVYYWGMVGAALTVVLGSAGFLVTILYYYRKVIGHNV
jgi:O-antigen/teichoic acid export membrane protein